MIRFLLGFIVTIGVELFIATRVVQYNQDEFPAVAFFIGMVGLLISVLGTNNSLSTTMSNYNPEPMESNKATTIKAKVKGIGFFNPLLVGSLIIFLYGVLFTFIITG
ncbi:hypothetical protein ACFO3D_08410 [Virgibacillus kekensis]|uniref:Uncharacterized protein n=1 Tax=Virgibacillus kekensis TaxID=202261 RepID=A0ABV9DIT1_9BACI